MARFRVGIGASELLIADYRYAIRKDRVPVAGTGYTTLFSTKKKQRRETKSTVKKTASTKWVSARRQIRLHNKNAMNSNLAASAARKMDQ